MTSLWPILCSTGAFTRDPDRTDYLAILHYAPLLETDGFEVIFFPDWYPSHVAISIALRASALHFPVLHSEKSIGPLLGSGQRAERTRAFQRLALNCEFAHAIGAQTVVLHLWGLPESDDLIEHNLDALAECLTIADNYDLVLAIETIPCRRADPLTHIHQAIRQDSRCHVALDTEFLALHQQLGAALMSDWLWHTNIVRHIHIKDYDGQMVGPNGTRRYLHPGEGQLDFGQFFARLKQHSWRGSISLEASAVMEDGQINLNQIRRSLALLQEYCKV